MSTDDYGTEYIYPPAKWGESLSIQSDRICAADERFASVNEAIGTLQYDLEQHIAKQIADLADAYEVIYECGDRLDALEKAQPKPQRELPSDPKAAYAYWKHRSNVSDYAHIPSAEWEDIKAELEGLRAKGADVEMLQRMVAGLQRTDSVSVEIIRRLSSELRALRAFKAGVWNRANAVTCPVCDSKGGRMENYVDHLEVWTECRWCNGHGVLYARPKENAE